MAFKWPRIKRGENLAIIGPRGSGKTELAKVLLKTRRNAIAVDTKQVENWNMIGPSVGERDLYRIRVGRFIYRVPPEFIVDGNVQDAFFRWALRAKNRTVYVDEANDLMQTHGLKILMTQGRASNVGVWIATQRPCHIPLFLISEAQHYFIFSLRLKADRDRIEQATGILMPWDELAAQRYNFVHVTDQGVISPVARLPDPRGAGS